MAESRMKFVFPIGLLLAFVLDGVCSKIFAGYFFTSSIAVESRLLLLWFVLAIFLTDDTIEHIYIWAFCAGIFYDMYYTSFLGLMALLLPFLVYLNRAVFPFFKSSFIVVLLIYLIDVTLLTTLNYWAMTLIGQAGVSLASYVTQVLWPTLIYNLALLVVLFVPLRRIFVE
ncbi:rod shape-determining protein MreD [Ligilactobacillus sp. WC1T17]|uniref:Rod shape-determining protein MreD n=1 Tax=Ligilactobacillus ruminis TaxID=1623 RepID=A0ABY1AAU4_9LACO|nr:rod shape-determining protein MreD [Ligilactobacillus ruminis]